MARSTYLGTASDVLFARTGPVLKVPTKAVTLTFWDAETGGTQYTDLLVDGQAATEVTIAADAAGVTPAVQGPDGVDGGMWVQAQLAGQDEADAREFVVPSRPLEEAKAHTDAAVAGLVIPSTAADVGADPAGTAQSLVDQLKAGAPAAYDTLVEIAGKLDADDDVTAQLLADVADKVDTADLDTLVATEITTTGSDTKAALSASYAPLDGLLWYDDFGLRADGSIAGTSPVFGGGTWSATGAAPPVVESGALVSSGVGYAYTDMGVRPDLLVMEIEFESAVSTASSALGWITGATWDLTNICPHVQVGPTAEYATVKRGATFYPLMPQRPWRNVFVPGQRYLVAAEIVGDQLVVVCNGDVHTTPLDPRINDLSGSVVFWEPLTVSGVRSKIRRVAAFKRSTPDVRGGVSRADLANSGFTTGPRDTIVASPSRLSQVSFGDVGNDKMARINFGATEVRTTVATAASIGATTLVATDPMPASTSVVINPGMTDEETVTTSGNSTGSGPYTHTLSSTLTKAHAVDAVLVGTVVASRRTSMYLNTSTGYFQLPDVAVLVGPDSYYMGSDVTTRFQRLGSKRLGMPADHTFTTGRNATASRPSAATVGAGAQFYDTTLSKPIWSDGTNWRDASGTVV